MKIPSFGRWLVALFAAAVLTAGASAADEAVVALGSDIYAVTREAKNTFNRDVNALKAQATAAAESYCAAQGRVMKVVTYTVYKPRFISGYANAKLVFKALLPGDPELTSAPPPPPSPVLNAAPVADDLYAELLKLDDLHKRGILSDKEFATEKKKALKRRR